MGNHPSIFVTIVLASWSVAESGLQSCGAGVRVRLMRDGMTSPDPADLYLWDTERIRPRYMTEP